VASRQQRRSRGYKCSGAKGLAFGRTYIMVNSCFVVFGPFHFVISCSTVKSWHIYMYMSYMLCALSLLLVQLLDVYMHMLCLEKMENNCSGISMWMHLCYINALTSLFRFLAFPSKLGAGAFFLKWKKNRSSFCIQRMHMTFFIRLFTNLTRTI
jgi:hypothetical protein